MKSLKRTLCLVLALVMVLGLFGVASAAKFTDDNTIQYKEAVDVMTAIGAISGYTDGTFKPNGTITRAEAAKLVTFAVLGETAAKSLTGVKSSFTDVTVEGGYGWAIPSIEYLVKQGVINGRGDGTFDPAGNIDGYAVLKMLLCALGYGKRSEYIGDQWTLNVAIDAGKNTLTLGSTNTGVLSTPATREEVALYCFNAIQRQKVEYVSTLDIYTKLKMGDDSAETIKKVVYPGLDADTGADDLGRPATVWTNNNAPVGKYALPAARTITAKMDAKTVEATLKGLTVTTAASTGGDVTIGSNENGATPETITGASAIADAADVIDGNTGNGVAVTVYATKEGVISAANVVKSDVATVGAVNVNNGDIDLAVVTTSGLGGTYTIKKDDPLYSVVSGLKEGDRVIVTPKYDSTNTRYVAVEIVPATLVTGKVTTKVANADAELAKYIVNGTTYGVANNRVQAHTDNITVSTTNDAKVWLDSYGYIVDYEAVNPAAASTMFYALDKYQDVVNGRIVDKAKLLGTNGETIDVVTATAATVGNIYNVTVDTSTGIYTLGTPVTHADATKVGDLAIANKVIQLNGTTNAIKTSDKALTADAYTKSASTETFINYYAENVKFIYVKTESGKPTTVTAVLDGVQAVANTTAASGTSAGSLETYAIVEAASSAPGAPNVVTAVIIEDQAPAVAPDANSIAVVNAPVSVGKQALTKADGTSVDVPLYSTYVNGASQQLPVSNAATVTPEMGKFYTMAQDTTIPGAYKLATFTAPAGTGKVENKVVAGGLGNVLTLEDGTSISGKTAKVVDARLGTPTVSINASVAGILKKTTDAANSVTISAVYDTKTNEASVIYIMDVSAAARMKVELTAPGDLQVTNSGNLYSVELLTPYVSAGGTVSFSVKPITTTMITTGSDILTLTATKGGSGADSSDSVTLTGARLPTGFALSGANLTITLTTAGLQKNTAVTLNFTVPSTATGLKVVAAAGAHS